MRDATLFQGLTFSDSNNESYNKTSRNRSLDLWPPQRQCRRSHCWVPLPRGQTWQNERLTQFPSRKIGAWDASGKRWTDIGWNTRGTFQSQIGVLLGFGQFRSFLQLWKKLNFSAKEQISSTPRLSYESQGRLFRGSWVMVEFWDVLILSHTSYYEECYPAVVWQDQDIANTTCFENLSCFSLQAAKQCIESGWVLKVGLCDNKCEVWHQHTITSYHITVLGAIAGTSPEQSCVYGRRWFCSLQWQRFDHPTRFILPNGTGTIQVHKNCMDILGTLPIYWIWDVND